MLGVPGGVIHKNDGTIIKGGDLLPSGYFVLDPVETDGQVSGYTVTGGGLGHGAGMSQNGARLLAEQGKDYLTILDYFYRNVTLATMELRSKSPESCFCSGEKWRQEFLEFSAETR